MASNLLVEGDIYQELDGKLSEIKRQMRQPGGYPHDPKKLSQALQRLVEGGFGDVEHVHKRGMVQEFAPQVPDLSKTGSTFAERLTAREILHEFLTGEKIVFCDLFEIDEETLKRTDILPFFRPAGAINRVAMNWKVRLGMKECYEETDVMRYSGAEGPQVPELGFIKFSVKPDKDTLGDKAQCPDDLVKRKFGENQRWLDLFGYADADSLHFLLTGKHLDPETWTWFPRDRLPDGDVAGGYWYSGDSQSRFYWDSPQRCLPDVGARLATFFKLKS